jgi:hypothetical protein
VRKKNKKKEKRSAFSWSIKLTVGGSKEKWKKGGKRWLVKNVKLLLQKKYTEG